MASVISPTDMLTLSSFVAPASRADSFAASSTLVMMPSSCTYAPRSSASSRSSSSFCFLMRLASTMREMSRLPS